MKASVSKIGTATRCLKKYRYKYIEKIERIRKDAKPQLGVIGHEALKMHYTGKDWTTPIQNFENELMKLMDEERDLYAHIPSELYRMVKNYLLHWRKVDEGRKIIACEKAFVVKTPGGNEYEGIMDLVYEDEEGIFINDHKFVKQVPSESVRMTDVQTNMYFLAAPEALGVEPLGVEFDYIRTKTPTQPKLLKNGTMSRADIDTDMMTYLQAVRAAGLNPEDYRDMLEKLRLNVFFKRVKMPRPTALAENVMKDFDNMCTLLSVLEQLEDKKGRELYVRSTCKDCSWDCEYSELCFAELSGINTDFIRNANYKPIEKREVLYGEENNE